MVSAYLIVDTKIENEDAYEEYKKLARPIAENTVEPTAHVVARWMCWKLISGHRHAWSLLSFQI